MKTYMTPEEHARLHRRRARQTLGLLIAVLALVGIVTVVRAGVKGVATLFDDTQQKAEYEDRLEGLDWNAWSCSTRCPLTASRTSMT